jgi:hypothetical protein
MHRSKCSWIAHARSEAKLGRVSLSETAGNQAVSKLQNTRLSSPRTA